MTTPYTFITYSSTTISFDNAGHISDSANGFGAFDALYLNVAGTVSNNGVFTIQAMTAGQITVVESTATEAAGTSFTLTANPPIIAATLAIASVVRAINNSSGTPIFQQTFDYPPDLMVYSPAAIVYPFAGHLESGPIGTRRDIVDFSVEFLVPSKKLDEDMQRLWPLIDPLEAALRAQVSGTGARFPDANGKMTMSSWPNGTELSFLPNVDYAGIAMRGYRLIMKSVKIMVNV